MIFFWTPNLTYVFVVPFLSCFEVLLRLSFDLDLWGALGADFCPSSSVGVGLALIASNTLAEVS